MCSQKMWYSAHALFIFTFFFHQLSSWSLLLGIFWFLVTNLGEFYKSSKWWKNHQKLQPCIKVLNLSSHFRHLGGRGAGGFWRWRGIYLWDVEGKETGHWQSVDNVRENCCKGRSSHNWHLRRLLLQNFWSKRHIIVFYANRRISSAISSKVNPLNILPSNSKRCRTIFTFHLIEIGNPKVWPTNQLTWVGARDTCVSKNYHRQG